MNTVESPTDPAREVLLVGSVPLRPASRVFEVVGEELGGLLRRVTDGDQHGWIMAGIRSFFSNDSLEKHREVELSVGGVAMPFFRLRDGVQPGDLVLGPYGFAEEAIESYREFLKFRDSGAFGRQDVRFQVTMPGPGTSAFMVEVEPEVLLPAARAALDREIQKIVEAIPAEDLSIQIDVGMEAEHEEWRRRPQDFQTPVHEAFDWTLEQMADSVAWLADRVPDGAELGFHVCTIWHHYRAAGQDNATVVDEINAIVSRVSRRIDYLHMPTTPQHQEADFAPLKDLQLDPATTFYLGLIHAEDGLEGASRRMKAAQKFRSDFGIASFCGLGMHIATRGESDKEGLKAGDEFRDREAARAKEGALRDLLKLHRQVALTAS